MFRKRYGINTYYDQSTVRIDLEKKKKKKKKKDKVCVTGITQQPNIHDQNPAKWDAPYSATIGKNITE